MKQETKSRLKKFVTLGVGFASLATILAGCNQDGGQTSKPGEPDGPKPPVEQTQTTVSKIMADMEKYKNFDLLSEFNDVAIDLIDKNIEVEVEPLTYTVENHNFVVIAQNEDGSFTSVAVPLSETCENYIKTSTSKEALVLAVANLTGLTQIEESGKAAVEAKISAAIQTIENNVAAIENGEVSQLNTYVSDGKKIDLDGVYGQNLSCAYLREDNSVVAFEFDEQTSLMTMHHYRFNDAKNKTEAEIIAQVKADAADIRVSNPVKYNEALELPPLNVQVETITVDEIFEQNFASLSFDADIEAAFKQIYMKAYGTSNAETLFYSVNKEEETISIYFTLNGKKTSFNELIVPVSGNILNINDGDKELLYATAQLNGENTVNSDQAAGILSILNSAVTQIKNNISAMSDVSVDAVAGKTFVTATNDITDHEDYAKKLFPGKEIVAAYVGDMGPRLLTPDKFTDTSYSSNFKMAFVVKENENFEIHEYVCFVPNYESGTSNETLYLRFLNSDNYILEQHQVATVSNPKVVKENAAQAAVYDISIPLNVLGDVERSVEMIDAVSQVFSK